MAGPVKKRTNKDLQAEIDAMRKTADEKDAETERRLEEQRVASEQRDQDWREQLAALRAELATAVQPQVPAAVQAPAQLATVTIDRTAGAAVAAHGVNIGPSANRRPLVPRPKGKRLPDDPPIWLVMRRAGVSEKERKKIHAYVKTLISPLAGIDFAKCYKDQDATVIAGIVSAAVEAYPVLNRFEKRWPVLHYVQQFMGNHRGSLKKNGGLVAQEPRKSSKTAAERQEQARAAVKKANDNRRMRLESEVDEENIDPSLGA